MVKLDDFVALYNQNGIYPQPLPARKPGNFGNTNLKIVNCSVVFPITFTDLLESSCIKLLYKCSKIISPTRLLGT